MLNCLFLFLPFFGGGYDCGAVQQGNEQCSSEWSMICAFAKLLKLNGPVDFLFQRSFVVCSFLEY